MRVAATAIPRNTASGITHCENGALSFPPAGSPKTVNTARPTTITAAPPICCRPTLWLVSQ